MKDSLVFVVPGPIATKTGGFVYDRKMVEALRTAGRAVAVVELNGAYPFPTPDDVARADAALSAPPDNAIVVIDGLALGALPVLAEKHGTRLNLVALVHHPLADETGLSPDISEALKRSETHALKFACRIITTSRFTMRRLADYGVGSEKIRVVTPGTDPAPLAQGSGNTTTPVLLCPSSFTRRKGHADLFHALAGLKPLAWKMICVGNFDLDPTHVAHIRALRETLGLGDRIVMRDTVEADELARLYLQSDLVVLASHYEGYGMVVAEAIARGIAVVTTTGGALAETLPTGAGLAVPPGDVSALREELRRAISDAELRAHLAGAARAAGENLPTWPEAARALEAALSMETVR